LHQHSKIVAPAELLVGGFKPASNTNHWNGHPIVREKYGNTQDQIKPRQPGIGSIPISVEYAII
jgi:hypothetical protein